MNDYEIIQGRCENKLIDIKTGSVDAVITDPPYGVNIAGWDNQIPDNKLLYECLRVSGDGSVIWFGAAKTELLENVDLGASIYNQ